MVSIWDTPSPNQNLTTANQYNLLGAGNTSDIFNLASIQQANQSVANPVLSSSLTGINGNTGSSIWNMDSISKGVGLASNIWDLYSGYQNLQLSEKQYELTKDTYETNLAQAQEDDDEADARRAGATGGYTT